MANFALRPTRTWRLLGLAAVALGCVCAALLGILKISSDAGPRLSFIGGPLRPVYSMDGHARIGEPIIYGGVYLCVDGPGVVDITNVTIQKTPQYGNLVVRDFAVRTYYDHPLSFGGFRQTLASFGDGFDIGGAHEVSGRCPDPNNKDWRPRAGDGIVELGVEVARTSSDVEGGPGLEITYRTGDQTATYRTPYGILVCAAECPNPDLN
jgi:hypothetical protein